MGWASGSGLAEDLVKAAARTFPAGEQRLEFYKQMISAFEEHDCDTLYEIEEQTPGIDPMWSQAMKERGSP